MAIKVSWEPGYDRLPRLQWTMDDESLSAYKRFGLVNELTAGEAVFRQGQASDALFVVLEGEVAIIKDVEEIARVGTGLSIGEMGLLLGRARGATARAIVDTQVLELSRADLERMTDEEPIYAVHLYRVLAETLAEYLAISDED